MHEKVGRRDENSSPDMWKTKGSQIKGECQLNSSSEAMDFMINKPEEYEREWQKDKIIDTMKSDMDIMNEKVET